MIGHLMDSRARTAAVQSHALLAASGGPRWGRAVGLLAVLLGVLVIRTVLLRVMGHHPHDLHDLHGHDGHDGHGDRPGPRSEHGTR